MHPLIAYDLAKIKMAEMHAEAEANRLAATARPDRQRSALEPLVPARWALRRFFARLHLAGSGA